MPGWHSRHTGWGHTGREDPEVQPCLQSRGFLALPVLQLVRGSRLYCNQEYQLDLRVRTDGHLGATESYTLSSGTLNIFRNKQCFNNNNSKRKPLHPGQSNYDRTSGYLLGQLVQVLLFHRYQVLLFPLCHLSHLEDLKSFFFCKMFKQHFNNYSQISENIGPSICY